MAACSSALLAMDFLTSTSEATALCDSAKGWSVCAGPRHGGERRSLFGLQFPNPRRMPKPEGVMLTHTDPAPFALTLVTELAGQEPALLAVQYDNCGQIRFADQLHIRRLTRGKSETQQPTENSITSRSRSNPVSRIGGGVNSWCGVPPTELL
jgi:hypothetical protein